MICDIKLIVGYHFFLNRLNPNYMKYFFTIFTFLFTLSLFAQDRQQGHVFDMVMEKQSTFRGAPAHDLFGNQASPATRSLDLSKVVREGSLLQLDVMALSQARKAQSGSFSMTIPRDNAEDFDLKLIESKVLSDDFMLFASDNPNLPVDYKPGHHYMGIVSGDPYSVVSLSIFDDHVVGLISTDEGNYVLGKIEKTRDQYILYNDKDLIPTFNNDCGTEDDGKGYTVEELTPQQNRAAGDCVRIYVEVHEDITNDKGGVTQATDYVTGVFNQSAILYANDGITIVVSEMFVWNTTSPYTSTSTSTLLSQFQANNGNFNGDLGHLVGYAGGGGIAAGFSGICNSNPDNSMCYSGVQASYSNVPTYSWTVMVVTHEMGHLFGSRHTHACVWNGNNTAIDGCAGGTEGSCSLPGNPAGGGTIMSYCHQTTVGINMNNGFGPQPSAVVNNNVNNGSCLSTCNSSCATPTNTNTSNVTETTATLNWDAVSSSNDYTVEWRQSGASSWNSTTVSGLSYNVSGLTLATDYEWHVRANCTGGSGSYSSLVTFTTAGTPPPEYCASTGTNVAYEWIASVAVSNLTNNTGANGGYADFTAQSANLSSGTSYTMTLSPGFASTTYAEYWSVWIDYNGDYDFNDAGELVAQANGTGTVNPSFTVPASGTVASTRMRVSMLWNEYSTACQTFTYGEVEDYTVNISGTPPPTCDAPSGLSSSSITETTATVSWSAVSNANDYDLQIRVQGASAWSDLGNFAGTSVNITGMTGNTTYEWRVRSNCSSGSSTYSSVASFTTDPAPASCNAPSGLSSSAVTQTTATVSWNAVTEANDYTVQMRIQGSSTWDIEGIITGTSASATNLVSGTTYEWHVRSNCSTGSSAYSGTVTFTTEQATGGCTNQVVNFNNFESGLGIWNDGGSDCRRSSGDANYAIGTYCVRLRDNTSTSTMTTDNLNLSTYDEVTVDFTYYPRSMDNSNEDFWLQISSNGGGSYTTVEEWNRGDEFENNSRYYDAVTISGPFASNTRFRFRCDASGNSDWIYIDEVEISGCNTATSTNPTINEIDFAPSNDILSTSIDDGIEVEEIDQEFTVYPNPVINELTVEFISEMNQSVTILLTSASGQVFKQVMMDVEKGEQDLAFDVSDAAAGLYALTLVTENDVKTKMIVVQ